MSNATHFKGWCKPGPVPPGLESGVTVEPHETLDAISGHFRLFQLRDGHRFSTDDILTAWYGTTWCPTARTALDLGSGIGTVGMISAWRLPGAKFVTVEAQAAGLVIVRKRPVVFREGDVALIALFGLMRAEDLPEWFRGQTWTEPDLIIRTRTGAIHPEYSAVKLAIGFPP